MKPTLALILLPATLALGACMETQADRTMVGATATGAAAGALLNDNDPAKGALIGGAVGAAAGMLINNTKNDKGQCQYQDAYGNRYWAAC